MNAGVEERAAGEAAKARLELALKITSAKLSRIQEKVEAHESNGKDVHGTILRCVALTRKSAPYRNGPGQLTR